MKAETPGGLMSLGSQHAHLKCQVDFKTQKENHWLTSKPEVTEMMLVTVYSVEICWLGLEMWRRMLPWTMAPKMKFIWPMIIRANPFLISLLGPLSLSESKTFDY